MSSTTKYKEGKRRVSALRDFLSATVADTPLRQRLDDLLCQCHHWLESGNLQEYLKLHPNSAQDRLHRFLDASAGEGLVLDNIDAADLYLELFPRPVEPDPTEEELQTLLLALSPRDREKYAGCLAAVVPVRTGGHGQITSGIEHLVFATYEQKLEAWKLMK